MSHLQRLINVFDELGIPSTLEKEPHDIEMSETKDGKTIRVTTLVEQTLTIGSGDGYSDFFTEFYFDSEGKFITWAVWE